jgi:hypothetical protein
MNFPRPVIVAITVFLLPRSLTQKVKKNRGILPRFFLLQIILNCIQVGACRGMPLLKPKIILIAARFNGQN